MIDKRLKALWPQLQGSKPHMPQFLSALRLDGLRGIRNLRVVFDYPVSVVAGGNASGKSTVLFAAACAYKVPGAGPKDYVPSTLFPNYAPQAGARGDDRGEVSIGYEYSAPGGALSMRWRRKKGWTRSFFGRKGARQPQRPLYLRTLSNLSNPSEVRGVLQMSRLKTAPLEQPLTAVQTDFAEQMLPFRYREVVRLSSGAKSLLFATHKDGAAYSELHMAAGERALLRLSQEIAQLQGALVLIDEVETGLHPWVQQLLMLQLQQLALRNDLQIIVTSHSPVVLDSVPFYARIFLDRDAQGNVKVCPPYRDLIQDALYGRSNDVLNLLCEDEAAEGILHGILDYLAPREDIRHEQIRIGRDTSAQEFPAHAAAFRRFGLLANFVFVLDGDQRDRGVEDKLRQRAGDWQGPIFFLPGDDAPEVWIWECLKRDHAAWAASLGTDPDSLGKNLDRLNAIYDSASDTPAEIAKRKLANLAQSLKREAPELCRLVAREEMQREDSELRPLANRLADAIRAWRRDA